MFDGAPRVTSAPTDFADEVQALNALIGSRRVAEPELRGVKKPGRLRRSRSGRDWLSIGAAALAVVSVVSASTLVGISVASASPASDALNTLTANEAVLANSIERVNSSISALEQSRQTAKSDAEALAAPLASLAQIAEIPAVATAETARQALLAEIDGVKMPDQLAAYRRPAIDGDSLESVGTAIDLVDTRTREAQEASAQLDDLRTTLAKTVQPFEEAVAGVGRELPAVATTLVSENDLADETLRTNVTSLAARVATVESHTSPSAISDFVNAVAALKTGQRTAEIEEADRQAAAEAERRRQQELQRQQQLREQQEQEQQPQPSTPPASPAPSQPAPAPSESSPAPSQPAEPGTGTGTDPGTGTGTGTGTIIGQ